MAADDYHIVAKHGKTTTASAVSPNSIKRPALKDRIPAKPDMPEVNTFMICQLCSGYLIDATAIIECQHTFCKSCILKYLETSSYCPVCDVQLNKGTPHLSLRSDVILQRLVYKLVPGLLVSEIRRRRDFSIKKGIDYPEAAELASNSIAEEIETPNDLPTVLTLDDVVSLSIEYYRSGAGDKGSSADTASSNKVADTNGKPPQQSTVSPTATNTTTGAASTTTQSSQNQQQKSNVKSNASVNSTSVGGSNAASANTNTSTDINSGNNDNEQANDRRYLQCPAAVSVGLLKKFIRMKYGLSDDYRVDLLYNGDRDSILENDLTLVDVAFIFKWNNKEEPMNIHYRIFERPVKSVTVYAGMKRPAPSVMDEPPDDDTASGPHNRSSMFSSSSAPSSKLPRLADNTSTSGNQGSVRNSNTSGKSTSTSTEAPATAATSSASTSASSTASASAKTVESLPSKSTNNNASSNSTSSSSSSTAIAPTHHNTSAAIKVEKEEVEEDEDNDDDDEDEDEDYELVERKEHMKGIKSSRRLNNKIKESMKRSVAVASSNSNIRSHHISSSSRSHSTDTKGSTESERESARNENSLNSSSNKRNANISVNKKRGKSTDEGKGKSGKVESLRLRVSSTSSSSSNSSDNNHQHQPLKLSISTTGATPSVVSSSSAASVEKKEPLKLSLGSVLANKSGSKSPERKHHKHKHHHHHHHKLRHRDKQGKGAVASATVTNNSQKPLKLSFTLSPPSATTVASNQSQKSKQASQESGAGVGEVKEQQNQSFQTTSSSGKGKPLAGMQNYNNSARTSASAHGHLNNISKSISVSVNTNANANNNTTNTSSSSANSTKGSQQHGNKMLSPAELIPKNTGIEIQPTTMPISSSHGQMSSHQQQHSAMQSGSSASGNNNSHKHSHPLLPDSVHVPKSVTLIPVNPNQMSGMSGNHVGGVSSGQNMGKMNNTLNTGITMTSSNQDKKMSGSQGNPHRINSHTFTHPITNKSLHQITVTEVPPPQQKSSGSNAVVVTTTSTTHSSISVSTSNPIEKVIANAANKPQFNGPGSMEITKIYCGTASAKDNAAKKLKDRKGLDISITGPGINVSMNKPNQKLEEALRQKVNMAIGGGSGSISVTPAAPPNNNMGMLNSGGNSGNSNVNTGNKMKSVSAAAASLLSGKMPPGITIGPATVPNTSSNMGNHNNSGNNVSSGVSGMNNMMNSANAGNNIMKGLGFTLPPHLTAHPHTPNNTMKISNPNSGNNSQAKSDKIMMSTNTMNANRVMVKDSVSIIGKGNVTGGVQQQQQQQQQPPPVEITISASGGAGKNQANITSRGGISIVNKSKMSNDPLASIFDITQGLQRKSPTLAINSNNAATTKDTKGMPTNSGGGGGNNASSQQQANKNANMANKRPFELVSIGGVSAVPGAQGNNNKKPAVKESPEQKKSRSASTSSEPDKNKNGNSSSSTGEIPLDLSGRSTRTTPPITIPNPRESSKSPSEKPRKSPERAEKPGIVITPSASQLPQAASSNLNKPTVAAAAAAANNYLSPKINFPTQKNSNNSPAADSFKGQTKAVSVSKLSPNQSSKISSIVDSLAQKQAQAQQQQQQQQNLQNYKTAQNQQHQQNLQNMKNSQVQQQQQNFQNMKNSQIQQQQQQHLQNMKNSQHQQQQQQQSHHHPHPSSNTSSSGKIRIPSPNNNTNSTTKSSPGGNNTKVSPSSSGLNSPISASPVSPMTSPSPPAGDHLRNLWTLSNSANQQGKLNQMNELLVAASLFSPSGHPHLAGAAAAHQLAAAAAAAVAASGSPSGAPATGASGGAGANSAFNSNLFAAQFGHHLAALGAANKIPPGMFDPHFMAALQHNAQAAHVAGMRMHHPFVGGMSPPLNMPNAFFPPHGAPGNSAPQQQQQQQPTLAAAPAGLKIPSVASKQGASPSSNSAGQPGKSPNSAMSYSPMFSHSHASPKSPNSTPLPPSSSISMKSPTSGSPHHFQTPSSMPGNTTVSNQGNNITTKHEPTKHSSSHSHTSAAGKSSHQHHHHQHHHTHDSPSTHSTSTGGSTSSNPSSGSKSTKINGTVSTAMPVFPPGIHNPLLPSRSSSSSNSSGNSFQSGSSVAANTVAAALNKSFSALNKNFVSPSSNNSANNPIKGAIPNSMKISNFLPSKPKDASSDANAEATITSGSNFGIMPPLQAKPNFSLSPTRSVSNNLISPSVNIPKSPSAFNSKEIGSGGSGGVAAPISPVKGVGGTAVTSNKPSTMTCASLLRPDSLYPAKPSHHTTHHLMNSLSPPKGDNHHHSPQQQHHLGSSCSSRLTNRTPSSDSALLSPGSASTNKTPSPGASTSNKSHNVSSKDGFRSSEPATQQHHHSSNKSLSPSKEIIASKKEIGSIPSGPAAALGGLSLLGNRNFTSAAAVQSLSLARPIPTIPAFLNRTASINNPCTMSSNINLHNMPFSKDGLQQKSTSPNKISSSPTSPVKMSNEQKTHAHLPSPVFPFPGVSVPVQVKLQDEDEAALPAVTSTVTTSSSLSALASVPSAHPISLKSEVNKLLAAKEEKMEEKRKRSFSLDQESSSLTAVSSSNLLTKTCSSHSDSETTTMSKIKRDLASPVTSESNKNSCEIPPPAKLQKIEMQAGVSSSVKNENSEPITEKKFTGSSSNSESIACEQETMVKSESELLAQRESKEEGEGERIEKASNEKKGDADVVVGADPSKEFSTCAPANATSTTTTTATPVLVSTAVESPCKTEVETPSPVKAVEVSVEKVSTAVVSESEQPAVVISESETQTKEETSEEKSGGNVESSVVTKNEKSTTQITVDMPRKSDDTSIQIGINPQESESSFEIPKEQENGQLKIMESVEGCEMADDNNDVDEVDVEMVKDQVVGALGQSEAKQESELQMDTSEGASNQMEVDAELIEENKMEEQCEEEKQNIFVEERVKLVKAAEDEDVDVDVLDVGVDDQMETNIGEMVDSVIENDGDAEELCIDEENNEKTGDETAQAINEPDSMEVGENEEETVKNDDELIQSQSENDNSSGATTTISTSFQNDDSINTVENVGEDMSEEKDVGKEVDCVKDPVEISTDVIKKQKVEETNILPESQPEENLLATSQVSQESINEEQETVSEENDIQVESTFLAGVNEASNFSQDDSECGDLVIDLGPNAGETEVDGDADDNDDGHEPSAENEENNEKEAIELLTQNDSNHSAVVQLEIKEIEENTEVNSAANCLFVTSQNSTEPQLKDCEEEEIENALPILSTEETIQVASTQEQQGEENVVQELPSCEEKQEDDDIGTTEDMMIMESSEPTEQAQEEDEQQVAHVYDDSSLNQDSIPNQITINPPSIEVNGVIKTDKESEKREESESKVMVEDDVAECPQQNVQLEEEQGEEENVNDYAGVEASAEKEERGTAEFAEHSGNRIDDAPEEDNKNTCEVESGEQAESTVCGGVMVESNAQLGNENPVTDTTIATEDNKNTADNNEASSSAVDDKKIEEEQEQLEQQQLLEEQKLLETAMLPEPESFVSSAPEEQEENAMFEENVEMNVGIGAFPVENVSDDVDDMTAPVIFPEEDNKTEKSENILGIDDSSSVVQEPCLLPPTEDVVATPTEEVDMGTPMEIEESMHVEECEEMMMVDAPVEDTEMTETETNTLTMSEIDDKSMQMDTDNGFPSEDSSTCVPSFHIINDQILSCDSESGTETTPMVAESDPATVIIIEDNSMSMNSNSCEESSDVAVISATITTTSATVTSDSLTYNTSNSEVTPTTSTSSVAINVDIEANDNDNDDDDDDAKENAAASLSPSSIDSTTTTTTISSSSLIIPSSNNTSASSSSSSSVSASCSSSPVDVPTTTTTGLTGIGSKSLETFGKVAAGLLASATSTINNNNNNTSLSATTCDAISIATTNANA